MSYKNIITIPLPVTVTGFSKMSARGILFPTSTQICISIDVPRYGFSVVVPFSASDTQIECISRMECERVCREIMPILMGSIHACIVDSIAKAATP